MKGLSLFGSRTNPFVSITQGKIQKPDVRRYLLERYVEVFKWEKSREAN